MMMTSSDIDVELLKRLCFGDRDALEAIYKKYASVVFRNIGDKISTRSDCEEVCTEVFVYLWQNRNEIDAHIQLKAHLNSITNYKLFQYIRDHPESEIYKTLSERFMRNLSDDSND